MTKQASPTAAAQLPGPWRRLAALIYEILPVLAIAFLATAPALLISKQDHVPAGHWGFRVWLLIVVGAYFIGSWLRGGQTIGAKAWRLRVVNSDGGKLQPKQAFIRYVVALIGWLPAGLGHWWGWFEPQRRGWHDLVAGTRLVHQPKASVTDS